MKKQSQTLFAKINKETITDLTSEIKETIATGFAFTGKKKFTPADLWNIQRRHKSFVQRRLVF